MKLPAALTLRAINVLTLDTALVLGKWELTREKDKPWRLFTLLLKKTPAGWRAASDNAASAQ
jgi:ketosteroid isomerase-like protein